VPGVSIIVYARVVSKGCSLSRFRPLSRVIKTRHLFYSLVKRLQPQLVLDIGSRDGSDALEFRRASPTSRILAFEANPDLYGKMREDPRVAAAGIEVHNFAISNETGEASFGVFNKEKGLGSLMEPGHREVSESLTVKTRRLDEVPELQESESTALWIDVEGASFEVVEGARGIMSSVILVHAEVEFERVFANQKVAGELSAQMEGVGFVPFFTGVKRSGQQGNIVFLRSEIAGRLGTIGPFAGSIAYRIAARFGATAPH